MIKKIECSFCHNVKICINHIPSFREMRKNKKGEYYIIKGYWLCRNSCYKQRHWIVW